MQKLMLKEILPLLDGINSVIIIHGRVKEKINLESNYSAIKKYYGCDVNTVSPSDIGKAFVIRLACGN